MRLREVLHPRLPVDHPTAIAFLDETGSIAQDRIFAVGCLIVPKPAPLLRAIQTLRDRHHWYDEIKWVDLTLTSLPLYRELLEIVTASDARFSCFDADREVADPVRRFKGDAWLAYQKLATQLLIGSCRRRELVSVVADNYSTPDGVIFEERLRAEVNRRLGHLVLTTVCRLDSRSCDPVQVVDVLTGAVAFEFRQRLGLAGSRSAKALLAAELREMLGVDSFVSGIKNPRVNVAVYNHGVRHDAEPNASL